MPFLSLTFSTSQPICTLQSLCQLPGKLHFYFRYFLLVPNFTFHSYSLKKLHSSVLTHSLDFPHFRLVHSFLPSSPLPLTPHRANVQTAYLEHYRFLPSPPGWHNGPLMKRVTGSLSQRVLIPCISIPLCYFARQRYLTSNVKVDILECFKLAPLHHGKIKTFIISVLFLCHFFGISVTAYAKCSPDSTYTWFYMRKLQVTTLASRHCIHPPQ